MSDSDDTFTMRVGRVGEKTDDATRAVHIEIAGRLVSKEHLRRTGKGSGDGDALLLAAREGTNIFARDV